MTYEQKMKRASTLKAIDNVMRNLDDEEYIMWWLEEGIPDGTADEDYTDYTDSTTYIDLIKTYHKICKAYNCMYPEESFPTFSIG